MPAAPSPAKPADHWLRVTEDGLWVEPGGFHVDPLRPVDRAVITHGHADHARPGHRAVLATAETCAIMRMRLGESAGMTRQAQPLGQPIRVGDVTVTLQPAGHVLGSAQVVLEHGGTRVVVSGDYKRRADPTCAGFEPVPCDVLVTEATFGLPVFNQPPPQAELAKLLRSLSLFPERAHVVGAYALGKAQRLIAMLRAAGWDAPVYLHGALTNLCGLYEAHGIALGDLVSVADLPTGQTKQILAGAVVLAPPSATTDKWARRLPDPLLVAASGWMQIRARARQRGVELPLVLSDHVDWPDLCATIDELDPAEVWVTHGREEALVHWTNQTGRRGRALAMIGFDEE